MVTDVQPLSFEAWVTPRLPELLRFAYLVTGSAPAAQDAVQSALAGVLERWERLDPDADPDAYVRRAIANAHISAWRRFGRRQVTVADPHSGTTAADPATAVAEHDAVWRLCAALPPTQRAAVVLRFYEDLDYPDIARILGCAEATARSHIHRALTRLRTHLTSKEMP
ncbi:MAG: SigE family RNA polymerase sigma factor [Tetrasphaera sp.]|jgi:RNA polymerase sigma-70 factor (sigma-E family)|nr:SigE family RNA polymerase sigma factor [Tetrasphaera sp.]